MFVIKILLVACLYVTAAPTLSNDIDLTDEEICAILCLADGRQCRQPPSSCGNCFETFTEHNGKCLRDVAAPSRRNEVAHSEQEIDATRARHGETRDNAVGHKNIETDSDGIDLAAQKEARSVTTLAQNKSEDQPAQQQAQRASPPDAQPVGINSQLFVLFGIVAACSVAGLVGVVIAGVCWYKLQKNVKAASEVEYPAYGITEPTVKEKLGSPGDRKLAHSAQMYHYQHQKQQMLALEKANGETKTGSDVETEDENEEGDYTVYECPGLAPTGEMEVKNPMFGADTPQTPTPSGSKKDGK